MTAPAATDQQRPAPPRRPRTYRDLVMHGECSGQGCSGCRDTGAVMATIPY